MTENEAVGKVVNQFTRFNPTGINCVNKGATKLDSFKEDVYEWMEENIDKEYHDMCWEELYNAAWSYDILTSMINDDGSISDVVCHAWNNVWYQKRGKWMRSEKQFRDEDHYARFFIHVCMMNSMSINENNAIDNTTDINTSPDFRLRLNFIDKSVNTDGTDVLSIRKIPKKKKTFEILCRPEEGMLTLDMLPIVRKHIKEAHGILIVGMSGSGKTTFLNALIEDLPADWKCLFIQENEELYYTDTRNCDFLKTVKGRNEFDIHHDLKEMTRNALLMGPQCIVVGETKGAEALYLFNVMNTGSLGITTAHSDSSQHGLDKVADYIKYESDYTKDQCMDMLTIINKVFFLDHYRLREITTVTGYDSVKQKLIMDTEYYNPNPY